MAKLTAKQAARARKKERKAIGLIDGIKPDVLARFVATRVVCDRCGLEQHDAKQDDYTPRQYLTEDDVVACVYCGHDTGRPLDSYELNVPEWWGCVPELVNSL